MKASERSKARLDAVMQKHADRARSQAAIEDATQVFPASFVGVDPQTRLVRIRLLNGQVVSMGRDFSGSGYVVGDSLLVTFGPGSSRATAVARNPSPGAAL